MCVCDLATILSMNQSAISHQLRILKQARLISARREGKQVFYSLADDHVHHLLDTAIEHIAER
jgi:ArsR family transcriptional regulator